MKIIALIVGFSGMYLAVAATDMAETMPTIATVKTVSSGVALVTCADPGGWKFDVKSSQDDGRDVVTVTLVSDKKDSPPRFGVLFRVSGAGVQNVWTSDCGADGFHLWPQLWWGWASKGLKCQARLVG